MLGFQDIDSMTMVEGEITTVLTIITPELPITIVGRNMVEMVDEITTGNTTGIARPQHLPLQTEAQPIYSISLISMEDITNQIYQ